MVAWAGEESMANPPSTEPTGGGSAMTHRVRSTRHARRSTVARGATALFAVLLALSIGGPAISSAAAAAVPPVDALVRVQPGSEAAVASAIRGLGGDPHQPLKVLNGY